MATTTRTEVLTEVQTESILQISCIETVLSKNFTLIVEELRKKTESDNKRDGDIKNLYDLIANLTKNVNNLSTEASKSSASNQTAPVSTGLSREDLDKRFEKERADMMKALDQKDKALQDKIQAKFDAHEKGLVLLKEQIKGLQHVLMSNLSNLQNDMSRIDSKCNNLETKLQNEAKLHQAGLEKLKNQISANTNAIFKETTDITQKPVTNVDQSQAKRGSTPAETQTRNSGTPADGSHTRNSHSASKELADLKARVEALERESKQLAQNQKNHEQLLQKHTQQIWNTNEEVNNNQKECLKKDQELSDRIDELAKLIKPGKDTIDRLKELERRVSDLSKRWQTMADINDTLARNIKDCQDEIETLCTNLNTSRGNLTLPVNNTLALEDSKDHHDSKSLDLVKKELMQKVGDQRKEYMALLKNMRDQRNQSDSASKPSETDWDTTIVELRHMISKKADDESCRKGLIFLEKKINYIFNTFMTGAAEEDARVGRKNWFCLSCDRRLTQYTGKLGDHIPGPVLKGSKLATTIPISDRVSEEVNGALSMRYKSKSKLDLPTLSSTNVKKY